MTILPAMANAVKTRAIRQLGLEKKRVLKAVREVFQLNLSKPLDFANTQVTKSFVASGTF